MEDKRFDNPVHVMIGGAGNVRIVSSTREASECLLKYRWPKGTGPKHRSARKACLDVLAGLKKTTAARRAFEAAAKESGLLVSYSKSGTSPA
ncbi:DUF982 domain-containing protein [Mesorhizobium sp. YM1C-6-2]|uniref:DUF982 domain-containing protein n=1 Tax=Mesorhizobium sp. YM1C-6-2 TaxID=1827501 RepID=UPI000EF23469|nr:DUF982 domain-containing protein [Mesorhizobium sp. YM1C-6-2]RLP27907.1 DUF982 domain-containing protein [Mesorhizobium sp. YM1C-6-2]